MARKEVYTQAEVVEELQKYQDFLAERTKVIAGIEMGGLYEFKAWQHELGIPIFFQSWQSGNVQVVYLTLGHDTGSNPISGGLGAFRTVLKEDATGTYDMMHQRKDYYYERKSLEDLPLFVDMVKTKLFEDIIRRNELPSVDVREEKRGAVVVTLGFGGGETVEKKLDFGLQGEVQKASVPQSSPV